MQKLSVIASVLITAIIIVSVWFSYLYYGGNGHDAYRRVSIKVAPGTTFKEVQAELVEKGLLDRPGVFRWAAYLTGRETKIKTGKYLFRRGESVASILGKLVSGRVDYARIVIPEGLMLSEIASILQTEAEVDSAAFEATARDSALMSELGVEAPSLEGYLFPDTYLFDWPIEPEDVARRIVYRFHKIYDEYAGDAADSLGMTMNEIVTLASIIEAEAVFDSEMPRISAVYHNRLKAGWRLEADPTVAYALGGVRRKLWYKDLGTESPYNTYRVKGLPPGAICNPGRTAIAAAAHPTPGSRDFYFVANGSGRHKFSATYHEHLRAKHLMKYGPVPPDIKRKPMTEAPDRKEVDQQGSGVGRPQDSGAKAPTGEAPAAPERTNRE